MNSKRLAIAVMTTAFVTTMVSAHLPSGRSIRLGNPDRVGAAVPGVTGQKTRATIDVSQIKTWDQNTEGYNCKIGDSYYIKKGEFKGTDLYWKGSWYPDKGDMPGEFADSGSTSAWGLINSKAFTEGREYQWVGWNSNAGKWEVVKKPGTWEFTENQIGNWGSQLDSEGPGAYVPTWRDGN